MNKLEAEQLLLKVLNNPSFSIEQTFMLNNDEIENLQELVMDHFLQVGVNSNDEPTQYGLKLEALIDYLDNLKPM